MGEGILVNCSKRKVINTAAKFFHSNGEGTALNNRNVAAAIIPTTTAFIPSIALKTTTYFFKLFQIG